MVRDATNQLAGRQPSKFMFRLVGMLVGWFLGGGVAWLLKYFGEMHSPVVAAGCALAGAVLGFWFPRVPLVISLYVLEFLLGAAV